MSDDDIATTQGGPAEPAADEVRLHSPRGRTRVGATASIALVAALVVTGVGFGGVALGRSGSSGRAQQPKAELDAAQSSVAPDATITVTGSGTVRGTPDTVSFQIGVHTVEPAATTALSDNDSQVTSLEGTLMNHGVTKADLQTSGLDIFENTSHGVLTGFTVDDDLNVTMHGIADAGAAIEAAAQAYSCTASRSRSRTTRASSRRLVQRRCRTQRRRRVRWPPPRMPPSETSCA